MIRMAKSGLKMPRVDQIGIVVKDIESSIDHFESELGIGPWALFEGEPVWAREGNREVTYRGKIALANSGRVQLELIEITEGRSLYRDSMGDREGLHHIGFFVRDFDRRLEVARAHGVEILQQAVLKKMGLTIEYAYLDTTKTAGLITEYIKWSFLGLPFPTRLGPLVRLSSRVARRLG